MRRFVRGALALAVAVPCGAQEPTRLYGVVRDPSGAPIPGASITVKGTTYGTLTNDDGRFMLRNVGSDSSRAVFLRIGFERLEARFDSLYASADSRGIVITLRPIPPTFDGPRPPKRQLNIHDDTVPEFELIAVTRAAKLRALTNPRTSRDPEIRLAMHGGRGMPYYLVVLRSKGSRVTGDTWLWWPRWAWDSTNVDVETHVEASARARGCRRPRWVRATMKFDGEQAHLNAAACRASLARAPDWRQLWQRLDSLGVWTLPHGDELPSTSVVMTDGIVLTIEMFDGARFRSVTHMSAEIQPSPESKRAAAILESLMPLVTALRRADTTSGRRE